MAVLRYPARLPSDLQVLQLKHNAQLNALQLHNVLVLSTHRTCTVAPAHLLSGGDYDGDEALVLFDSALVPARAIPDREAEPLAECGRFGEVMVPSFKGGGSGRDRICEVARIFGAKEHLCKII